VLGVDEVLAVGEAHDERLEVLRDEDDVRGGSGSGISSQFW
jgi:hypothetical protein